jgi:TPR repeat protein
MLRRMGFVLLVLGLLTPGVVAADGERYALLVGIQKYDDPKFEPIEYTERDMTDLAAVLEKAGYNVTVMTDSTGLKDKALEPTKANIDKSLKVILDKAHPEDLILVAFAGHGLRLENKPGDFICPKDAKPSDESSSSMISLESLCEKLGSRTEAAKILLIDACRNSPKSDLASGIEGDKVKMPTNVYALFSCSSGERSIEHRDLKHGVFFRQVLEGLKGKAGDGNDAITFASLAHYVVNEVPKQAVELSKDSKQTPIARPEKPSTSSPRLAMHPEAIPAEEWKEYERVWSKGSTEPFLKKYAPKRFASWRKSAEAGSARGMMLVADCLEFGIGGAIDPKESADWYGKSANLGNSFAMVGYGMCYEKGFGVNKNTKEAVHWFRKSADLGDPGGMSLLASCYARGSGIGIDQKEAVRWYRKSADLGFAQAIHSLAIRYLEGQGVDKDEKEGVKWLRKGSEQGDTVCMIYLGFCYRDGIGVEEDEKEAVVWYRKAATAGSGEAMYLLGQCYMEGHGVEQDEKEGAHWFRKSAEQDNVLGMLNLGICYLEGKGVTKSRVEAVRWLRKASNRGNAKATKIMNSLID